DFLALSDHNTIQLAERWTIANTNKGGMGALERYRKRFGSAVQEKDQNGKTAVRWKTLADFRKTFEQPEKFLLIESEEITHRYKAWPVHMCASNLREIIQPKNGDSVLEVLQSGIDSVRE